MPGHVTHVGFNDLFPLFSLSTPPPGQPQITLPNLAFDRAKGCDANTLRFDVN